MCFCTSERCTAKSHNTMAREKNALKSKPDIDMDTSDKHTEMSLARSKYHNNNSFFFFFLF